jgi:hypothetical protein
MVKRIFLLYLLIVSGHYLQAQRLDAAGYARIQEQQDSLQYLSQQIFGGKDEDTRQKANDQFIPALVNALKTKYSFYFTFDSLKTVSTQYPQDSTFRIFTWSLENDNGFYRHFGAIQMNSKDGVLKLFPLFDNSDYLSNVDTVGDNKTWFGCLYYSISQQHFFNQEYYTLFGWDANNPRSQKKIMDMLRFKNGRPIFGGPFFTFTEDSVRKPTQNRFIIEYKKEASATLKYNKEMDMVVYDHLVSQTDEPGKKYTYVPDMDYEGFKWKAGKWVHVDKVFNDALQQGKVPLQQPLDIRKKNMLHPQTEEDIEAEKKAKKEQKKGTKQKN